MKIYEVAVTRITYYHVEAETRADATNAVLDGAGDEQDSDIEHTEVLGVVLADGTIDRQGV